MKSYLKSKKLQVSGDPLIHSELFPPMKLPFPVLWIALLSLAFGVLAGPFEQVIAQQPPRKNSTPDPYFNPKTQLQDVSPNTSTDLNSFPSVGLGSAVPPAPVSPADSMATPAWEPPRTSTFPGQKSPTDKISPELHYPLDPPTTHSIIRAQRPVDSEAVQSPAPNEQVIGDFSADLSKLKPIKFGNQIPEFNNNSPDNSRSATPTPTPTISNLTTTGKEIPANAIKFEPSQLLALVGSEPIFVGDLMFEVNQLIEKFMPTAPQSIKDQESKKLIQRLLPKFVDSKLLYIGTLEKLPKGADVSKILEQAGKEFDEKAMQQMMDSAGLKSPNEFDAQLRAQGSSLRKMRLSWSQDQLTKYFLSQQLDVDKEITHQAMLDDYHKHLSEYAIPARAKWEQVMIRFDRTSSRADAEKQLVEMGNQIVYGANFAAVAKKSSHGFGAANGGRHDWTSKDALVLKELDQAIFALPVGELSEKIETADGFHIVRVIERTDAMHQSFLEAQVEIKDRLLEEKRTAAFEQYLTKLRTSIRVEYFETTDSAKPDTLTDRRSSGINQIR